MVQGIFWLSVRSCSFWGPRNQHGQRDLTQGREKWSSHEGTEGWCDGEWIWRWLSFIPKWLNLKSFYVFLYNQGLLTTVLNFIPKSQWFLATKVWSSFQYSLMTRIYVGGCHPLVTHLVISQALAVLKEGIAGLKLKGWGRRLKYILSALSANQHLTNIEQLKCPIYPILNFPCQQHPILVWYSCYN